MLFITDQSDKFVKGLSIPHKKINQENKHIPPFERPRRKVKPPAQKG